MASTDAETTEFDLGPVEQFRDTPETVTVEGKRFFVVHCEDEYELYSSECPHQGGPVYFTGDRFECPVHEWEFDAADGERLDDEPGCLNRLRVESRDGRLLALLSPDELEAAHPDHDEKLERNRLGEIGESESPSPDGVEVDGDTIVGTVLDAFGAPARKILADYGMRCLGCALASRESIAEAADIHQLDDDEYDELLERLRALEEK